MTGPRDAPPTGPRDAPPTGPRDAPPTGPRDAPPDAPPRAPSPRSRGLLGGRHASAAVIGVLTLILGFAIAVQVRANSSSDSLSGLREDDLISILDNQNDRAERLRAQIMQLQDSLRRLRTSGNRSAAARAQAEQEANALAVLLGTVPAYGPGVRVTITDPTDALDGEDLLDVVEELRGAGAEAIQFGTVRVSTSTAFTGAGGTVTVDGTAQTPPYSITAIGAATTLDTALNIPGGVAATVRTAGGQVVVRERSRVVVPAVRALPTTRYIH